MEIHHCLPAASSDLGGLALDTGNKLVVTQELRFFFFFPFNRDFCEDCGTVLKTPLPSVMYIKCISFTIMKFLLAVLFFQNRIFLWEPSDFQDRKKKCRRLTPANDAEFQDVPTNVSVKYFHQSNIHVNRF